ncbi:MAG: hypothetical protein Q8Q10_00140 [bacterium]|nr:hypothetical protein [bacterium]
MAILDKLSWASWLDLVQIFTRSKGLGFGKIFEETLTRSEHKEKSDIIEASGLGTQEERIYLVLEAMFGHPPRAGELEKDTSYEEWIAFEKFLKVLTPAEAKIILTGIGKRESDVEVHEPVVLHMRRRSKGGEEYTEDKEGDKKYTVKTNSRGRSIIRGMARRILGDDGKNTEATQKERVNEIRDFIRHGQLATNLEDTTKEAGEAVKEKGQESETLIHFGLGWWFTNWKTIREAVRDPNLVKLGEEMEKTKDRAEREKLREEWQALFHQKVLEIWRQKKALAPTVPQKTSVRSKITKNHVIFIGVPLIIILLLSVVATA